MPAVFFFDLVKSGGGRAIVRAREENAVVILGSATPALESLANTETDKYHYLALDKRRVTGRSSTSHPGPKTGLQRIKPLAHCGRI